MPRELTPIELHNLKAAVDLIKRLKACCTSLAANDDFVDAFEQLLDTAKDNDTLKDWWQPAGEGDLDTDEEARTERRLWVLWVSKVVIRPSLLRGDRPLILENCDGFEIAKLAFIMLHEAYHLDGWADGKELYTQDLRNLVAWHTNLMNAAVAGTPCAGFPCAHRVIDFATSRYQEVINSINGAVSSWWGWFGRMGLRFLLLLILFCVGGLLAGVKAVSLAIAAILGLLTLVGMGVLAFLDWLLGP